MIVDEMEVIKSGTKRKADQEPDEINAKRSKSSGDHSDDIVILQIATVGPKDQIKNRLSKKSTKNHNIMQVNGEEKTGDSKKKKSLIVYCSNACNYKKLQSIMFPMGVIALVYKCYTYVDHRVSMYYQLLLAVVCNEFE